MTELSSAPATPGFSLKGWHVLLIVVGFFAVVVGVNVGFVTMALRTFPGEVSATPYEDGIAYNARLARMAAQESLGWRAVLATDAAHMVMLRLLDRDNRPLTRLGVTAALERPATESGRKVVALTETAPGVYQLPTADLHGVWDLTFTARDGAHHQFEAAQRLTLP